MAPGGRWGRKESGETNSKYGSDNTQVIATLVTVPKGFPSWLAMEEGTPWRRLKGGKWCVRVKIDAVYLSDSPLPPDDASSVDYDNDGARVHLAQVQYHPPGEGLDPSWALDQIPFKVKVLCCPCLSAYFLFGSFSNFAPPAMSRLSRHTLRTLDFQLSGTRLAYVGF